MPSKLAFTKVPITAIADLLGFPRDWKITQISLDPANDSLVFFVCGENLPVPDNGEMIAVVHSKHCDHCDVSFNTAIVWKGVDTVQST